LEEIRDYGDVLLNPLRLPALQRAPRRVAGDRRPGYRHCACCGGTLDGGVVRRGMWAYCSIECALRMESRDGR
jgi:hypothetical protein